MSSLEPESFRYKVLECARDFKSSWIELGQYLFTVYKDKLFREWGYLTFDAYTSKEIGIRQPTALKLLKSYSFLEKEEPSFIKREHLEDKKPSQIPGYEAVNALRIAKESDRLTPKQYEDLKEDILDHPKEDAQAKKKIRYVLRASTSQKPKTEEDVAEKKKLMLRKLLVQLENFQKEIFSADLPSKLTKQIDTLVETLKDYGS